MNPPAAVQRPDAGPASPPRRRAGRRSSSACSRSSRSSSIAQLLAAPHYVSRLTFQNPTPYQLLVEVSNGHGDGWLPLGTVDRTASTQFGEVYDVGDDWQFRVWAQGESAGRLPRVTRSQLEQSGWRVQIPREIGDDLVAAGVARQP